MSQEFQLSSPQFSHLALADAALADQALHLFSDDVPKFETNDHNLDSAMAGALRVGWIDSYCLTRDCMSKAFSELYPQFHMSSFASAQDCIDNGNDDLDLIIYYSHRSTEGCLQDTAAIREAFSAVRLIILSDSDDTHQIKAIRNTLQGGADGFISTRTMGLPMALAAIRFVQSGGTFAPLEGLLTDRPSPAIVAPEPASPSRLTSRQKDVLAQLQEGKANKIIAHELGMSESTVKVHVRNIMRKMGATNRTQAAFKALKLSNSAMAAHA
jgi:DNA-binding NarL/FixJ family response regulator